MGIFVLPFFKVGTVYVNFDCLIVANEFYFYCSDLFSKCNYLFIISSSYKN